MAKQGLNIINDDFLNNEMSDLRDAVKLHCKAMVLKEFCDRWNYDLASDYDLMDDYDKYKMIPVIDNGHLFFMFGSMQYAPDKQGLADWQKEYGSVDALQSLLSIESPMDLLNDDQLTYIDRIDASQLIDLPVLFKVVG